MLYLKDFIMCNGKNIGLSIWHHHLSPKVTLSCLENDFYRLTIWQNRKNGCYIFSKCHTMIDRWMAFEICSFLTASSCIRILTDLHVIPYIVSKILESKHLCFLLCTLSVAGCCDVTIQKTLLNYLITVPYAYCLVTGSNSKAILSIGLFWS